MKRRYNELLNEHLNEQDLSPLTPSEVSAQLDEAVALLRSSVWRLACESRNDLAVKNDRLQARNIESFLSRHDGSKVPR